MHREAREFVTHFATTRQVSVIEIGSLNVNGSIRDLFPKASWTGIDRAAGPCVDVVGDAEKFDPSTPVDVVICCEVLEHADNWAALIQKSFAWLVPGGVFIMTCAGLGREPHSCGGGKLPPGEYYRNLAPPEVRQQIEAAGFRWQVTRQVGTDLQSFAVKGI